MDLDEIERDLKQKYGMPTTEEMQFSKAQLLEESDESDTSESFEQQQKRTHSQAYMLGLQDHPEIPSNSYGDRQAKLDELCKSSSSSN
jgi:hypothetical protein